jgi:hypothetical protein
MKRDDIKPFVAHIKCDADYSDIDDGYGEFENPEVERVRVDILDGPFAGHFAWINLKDLSD